jgi:hypothetical protein
MKTKGLIITFGLLLILISCEKEAINYAFPITLISTEYQVTSELKLFTKSGQITDKLIIDNYLALDSQRYFYSCLDTVLILDHYDTLIYLYQDTVLFSEPGLWGKRIPKKEGAYIYFYLTDTLIGYKTIFQNSELKDIFNQIGLHKPFYEDFGPSIGYPHSRMFQREFNAKIAKGTPVSLEFPLLSYKLTRTNDYYRAGSSRKNYNNIFDINVLNLLESSDTLAIQEAKIIYKAID